MNRITFYGVLITLLHWHSACITSPEMAIKKTNRVNLDATLKEIVLKKIRQNRRLSKDEHWFYLTHVLKFDEDEAENILKNQKKA